MIALTLNRNDNKSFVFCFNAVRALSDGCIKIREEKTAIMIELFDCFTESCSSAALLII